MKITSYAEYQMAIARMAVLLGGELKLGSPEDTESSNLGWAIESYELSMAGKPFESEYTAA